MGRTRKYFEFGKNSTSLAQYGFFTDLIYVILYPLQTKQIISKNRKIEKINKI